MEAFGRGHAYTEDLMAVFPSSAYLDRDFSILHKIVLGQCPTDLRTYLSHVASWSEIDAPDISGLTALHCIVHF